MLSMHIDIAHNTCGQNALLCDVRPQTEIYECTGFILFRVIHYWLAWTALETLLPYHTKDDNFDGYDGVIYQRAKEPRQYS